MADQLESEPPVPDGGLLLRLDDRLWAIEPNETIIVGRSETCDVLIANDHVSRQHLELRSTDGVWTARDLSTMNGTFVEGERRTTFSINGTPVAVLIGGVDGVTLSMEPGVTTEAAPETETPVAESSDASALDDALFQPVHNPPAQAADQAPVWGGSETAADPASSEQLGADELARETEADVASGEALEPVATAIEETAAEVVAEVTEASTETSDAASMDPAEEVASGLPDPAWYVDPDDDTRLRYWDGQGWTDHYHPIEA